MVDTGVSKAPAFGFAGSSPAPGTIRWFEEVRKGPKPEPKRKIPTV